MIQQTPYKLILGAVLTVLAWRTASLLSPSSMIVVDDAVRQFLPVLGILYVACGALAHWIRPNAWTKRFLIYCVAGGIHWGGSIGTAHEGLEIALLLIYVAFSVLGETVLFHLSVTYPTNPDSTPKWMLALYFPAALTLMAAPLVTFMPPRLLEAVIGGSMMIAMAYSIAAPVGFLARLLLVGRDYLRGANIQLIVVCIVLGGLPGLLASMDVLGGSSDAWNLASCIIPIGLAVALVNETFRGGVSRERPIPRSDT